MKRYALILTLLLAMPCMAQDYMESSRLWDDGPLTWADFNKRNQPDLEKNNAVLDWRLSSELKTKKIKNVKFDYFQITTEMDKLLSWYDPDKVTDLTLRYLQTEFNRAEVVRRQFQNAVLENHADYYQIRDYYSRLIWSRNDEFEQESRNGLDSAVVARYAEEADTQLAELKVNDPFIPDFGKRSWGLGVYVGYENNHFYGDLSNSVGPFHDFALGFDFFIGNVIMQFGGAGGDCGNLRTDAFYYDSECDYNWQKGKPCTGGNLFINAGYVAAEKLYWKMSPYAGIGVTFIDQKTNLQDKKNDNSEISGFRMQAGVMTDWIFRHRFESADNGNTQFLVRLNLYAARTHFKTFGNVWSMNAGLVIGYDSCFLKKGTTLPGR